MNNYTIEEHKHRFASWGRRNGANVKGCRFSVKQAKEIIEKSGLAEFSRTLGSVIRTEDFDREHRTLRERAIAFAQTIGLTLTHGVAAKIINIYMKSILTCSGVHGGMLAHPFIHPSTASFSTTWQRTMLVILPQHGERRDASDGPN